MAKITSDPSSGVLFNHWQWAVLVNRVGRVEDTYGLRYPDEYDDN